MWNTNKLLTSPYTERWARSTVRNHSANLFVVDVDGDPLADDQLHGGWMTELHGGFDDQVDALVGRRDAVKVHRVVDGRVPGANR